MERLTTILEHIPQDPLHPSGMNEAAILPIREGLVDVKQPQLAVIIHIANKISVPFRFLSIPSISSHRPEQCHEEQPG